MVRDGLTTHPKICVTLSSHSLADSGIPIIRELPHIRSNARAHTADLDLEATYPTVELIMNISKETTLRELSKIRGLSHETRQMIGVNLTGGNTNAIEIGVMALGLPTPYELLQEYRKQSVVRDIEAELV